MCLRERLIGQKIESSEEPRRQTLGRVWVGGGW